MSANEKVLSSSNSAHTKRKSWYGYWFLAWDTFPLNSSHRMKRILLEMGRGWSWLRVWGKDRGAAPVGWDPRVCTPNKRQQVAVPSGCQEWKQQSPIEISAVKDSIEMTLQPLQTPWNIVYAYHVFEITSFIRPTAIVCYLLCNKYGVISGWNYCC